MSGSHPDAVKRVLKRANELEIPLDKHISRVTESYEKGGVQGFRFIPKDYQKLQEHIYAAIKRMVLKADDYADKVGAFMGSDARKNGFSVSARERNATNSLHIELSKSVCDAHLDSRSITTGHQGFPFWGGHYDPTRLGPHFLNDLLPFYVSDFTPRAAPFVNPLLKRLGYEVGIKSKGPTIKALDGQDLISGPARDPEGFRIGFSLTFNHGIGDGK